MMHDIVSSTMSIILAAPAPPIFNPYLLPSIPSLFLVLNILSIFIMSQNTGIRSPDALSSGLAGEHKVWQPSIGPRIESL